MMDDMDDMVDQYEMTIAVEWMVEYILEVRGVPPIRSVTIIDAPLLIDSDIKLFPSFFYL